MTAKPHPNWSLVTAISVHCEILGFAVIMMIVVDYSQVTGRLYSGSILWWCSVLPVLFNILRTPATVLATDDNASQIAEPDWLSVPFREQIVATSCDQSIYADSDVEGFDQKEH